MNAIFVLINNSFFVLFWLIIINKSCIIKTCLLLSNKFMKVENGKHNNNYKLKTRITKSTKIYQNILYSTKMEAKLRNDYKSYTVLRYSLDHVFCTYFYSTFHPLSSPCGGPLILWGLFFNIT